VIRERSWRFRIESAVLFFWIEIRIRVRINIRGKDLKQGFSTGSLGPPWGPRSGFPGGHEQRPLLGSSAAILQNSKQR